jgi:outer membrane receptor for ferrienterochelin and colicins
MRHDTTKTLRTLAVALVALASAANAPVVHAQDGRTLHGRVVDAKTQEPLEGAELRVANSNASTRSGTDGSWSLPNVVAGRNVIRVRRIGYSGTSIDVSVPRDSAAGISIALVPSTHALDAVVVTASRREQRLQDAPVTTTLIDRHQIEQSGASDIGSVLTEQTGIQFTGGHPSGSGVGLEGMSDQRVLVLIDGVPMYGRISDGLDITRVPTSAVERIEVVKGPQSTLYGSEAMGGVVNIITRQAGIVPASLDASLVVGNDKRTDASLYGAAKRGTLAGSADVGVRHIDLTPGIPGTAGTFADRRDGMGSVRWTPNGSFALDASAIVVNERQRWPDSGLNDFADNTQTNARVTGTWVDNVSRFTSTIALSQLDHLLRQSQLSEPIAGTGDRPRQRLADADVLYTRSTSFGVFDLGSQLRQEYIMSTDGRIAGGPRTLMSAEPYAQAEFSSGRWSIVPGARLAWSQQYGTFVSPRVATRFRVDSSLTLRASVGRGFRTPDFKELYLDWNNDAAFYAVHGNPALRPEHADNLTASAEWTGVRTYVKTMVYWNNLRDFIETEPLASSGQIAQYTYDNVTKSTTRGAEVETGATFGPVRADVGYAYLFSRDLDTDGPLLGQPAHSGRISVSGPLPLAIRASVIGVYTGRTPMERADDGSISSMREAYDRIDLRFARQSFAHADLSLGVDNIFDAHPALWADPTPRQFYAGITLHVRSVSNHIPQ